jgi:hypothetical protein
VEVVGDGDGASSASANGHWPGALKPLPVLLMTRPVLFSPPRTRGCCFPGLAGGGLGYFPPAGRGALRHPRVAHSRRGPHARPPALRAAATSARATFVASRLPGGTGGPPARTSPRGRPAPRAPRRAVQAWNGSSGPGGGGASRGAAEAEAVAAGSSPGPAGGGGGGTGGGGMRGGGGEGGRREGEGGVFCPDRRQFERAWVRGHPTRCSSVVERC